jgi:hypothetical protein
MARRKGSKNRRTMLREAEQAMGKPEEFVDSMHVLEYTMRHFYARALLLKNNNGKPEQIDADLKEAVAIAEKIAPYRHARLSAVKLAGDTNNAVPFKDDASLDEIREEIMQDLGRLVSTGVIDLKALPVPDGGISESAAAGVDQSGCQRGVII